MSTSAKTVTIAGVSGKLGQAIVKHILQYPYVHVNGLTRDPSSARPELKDNPRVTLFANPTPLDSASLRPACKGASIVLCTYLGSPEFERDGQIALIDAAIAEKVPRYLASDFTVDFRKVTHDEIPQKGANRAVDKYLNDHEEQIKGVHILNGAFMESLFSYWYFWYGPEKGIGYWGTGDETWELISYDTTAAYTAAVAVDENAAGWFEFLADRKTTNEVKQMLEQSYGVEVPMTCHGSFDDLVQNFEEGYKRAPEDQGFDAWKRNAYLVNLTSRKTDLKQPLDNGRYPDVRPETLKEWLDGKKLEDLIKTAWF